MSNYSKTTDFEAKDSLPTGDSGKIIRGAEFETEFDAISTAIGTKADTAGPTFTGTLTFETISDGTIGVTAFVDEDNMSSNSATLVPTQQSVKAYVDAQVTAQDLDFQADSGGALSIDLDSEALTFTGGTGVDTSGSGNAVTFAIDSTVATLTGTQTLTNKTLTSPDVNTPDIDGGTIDGAVIGGATPAAVSATTVSATGNITVGGTVDGRDVATDGTKLDGIEASADVTDTANVTAAGALMDSELTSIASVKALNQGVATTDSPTFAGATVNGTVEFDGLSGTGAVTVTDILDQDNMSSNSATALATQQSIKSYVDSQVATSDTLAEVLANGNATGGTDVAFGTNDKALFGANSDLQIYHDGGNSRILENGAGFLAVGTNGTDIRLTGNSFTEFMAKFEQDGAVTLYHNGLEKLATTSTGIDVTGTATMDGLTVEGSGDLGTIGNGAFNAAAALGFQSDRAFFGYSSSQNALIQSGASKGVAIEVNSDTLDSGTRAALFAANGDISFYEDTGTTAKFFWDAADESLGIGTSSPTIGYRLDILGRSGYDDIMRITGVGTNIGPRINLTPTGTGISRINATANSLQLQTGGTAAVTIDSSQNVGIGANSPDARLHIEGSAPYLRTKNTSAPTDEKTWDYNAGTDGSFRFRATNDAGTDSNNWMVVDRSGVDINYIAMSTGNQSETMRINSSGVVQISNSTPTLKFTDTDNNYDATIQGLSGSLVLKADSGAEFGTESIQFRAGGDEAMRIDSSRNVGIGQSNPSFKLHVTSADANDDVAYIHHDNAAQSSGTLLKVRSDAGASNGYSLLDVQNNSGTALYVAGDNKVGIGTSNPNSIVDIRENATGGQARLRLFNTDQTNSTAQSALLFMSPDLRANGVEIEAVKENADFSAAADRDIAITFSPVLNNTATERMRIDSAGNVGIGTSGPATTLDVAGEALIQGRLQVTSSAPEVLFSVPSGGLDSRIHNDGSGNFIFGTGTNSTTPTERMRIDSSGIVMVATTNTNPHTFTTGSGLSINSAGMLNTAKQAAVVQILNRTGNSDGVIQEYKKDGTTVGSISVTDTATTYNTSSDQRLKDNIVDAPSASDDIDAIQVRSFDWKADGSHQKYGMVAQELNTVAPEAVSAPEDPEEMMGVDYSKLVPMLVKEIQSLRARVAQLETN